MAAGREPTTAERGYGAAHQRERKRWAAHLEQVGAVQCVGSELGPCPTVITPTDAWDLGHTEDRAGYVGIQCVPCNRSDGGRNGARVSNARRQMTVRDW